MPSTTRGAFFVLVIAGALVAQGCSSGATTPQTCQAAAECTATARCISSACVANAAPTPKIVLPAGSLEANLLLAFDGSSSDDPDEAEGDSVVSHAWGFHAVAAACDPPVVAGTGPIATVRFACPGTYAVDLTVTDEMAASAVGTKVFDVGAHTGPSLLVPGPDVTVDHLCTAPPVRCAPSEDVVVSASAPSFAPEDLTFHWSVEAPPDRPLDANRRVELSPGAGAAAPAVTIETDGQAISGDWIFRVEARDAAGVIGTGAVRVSVGNRPPVVTETLPEFHHVFDAAGPELTMSANIPVDVVDPDGDLLVGRVVSWNRAGDGGAYFAALDQPEGVSVSVRVPYSAPADAAFLIGGNGLERSVTFSIGDVNGATVTEVWPIVVANHPPTPVSLPALVAVDHAFDVPSSRYVADATLSTWSDPDGDPIAAAGPTSDPSCAQLDVSGGAAHVACAMAYSGMPAVAFFANTHSITYQVTDPWTPSAAVTSTLQIKNRPPRLTVTSVGAPGVCSTSTTCCDFDAESHSCLGFPFSAAPASLDVGGFVVDDDGDPLEILLTLPRGVVTPAQSVCFPQACAFHLEDPGATTQCGTARTASITARMRDGAPDVVGNIAYSCR